MEVMDLPEVRNKLTVTHQGLKIIFMEDEEIILKSVGGRLTPISRRSFPVVTPMIPSSSNMNGSGFAGW
jgi:hypothetical protein